MGETYIKVEGGKEVVYERGVFGLDRRIGELHENLDGSKETRPSVFGLSSWFEPQVNVEREKSGSDKREGGIGDQKGVFDKNKSFGIETERHPSFKPYKGTEGDFEEPNSVDIGTDYRSGENSKIKGSSGSGLGLLVKGTITAVFLGALYFYVLDVRGERLQRPDTAVALVPSPAIPGDPYYTFDITSSSNNKGVLRITYSGNFLRRERTYVIDREKYPEVYRNLDINGDGEVSFEEFMEHASIFTNQKIAEGVREGDIESLVDKILKTTQTIKN